VRSVFKGVVVTFSAVVALGAVSVSAAQAAPEWFQKGKVISHNIAFTSTGGPVWIQASVIHMKCAKEEGSGEIEKPNKQRKVILTFTGCEIEVNTQKCIPYSKGSKSGEIVTKDLKGELGKVAKAEAASEVGLLIEPEVKQEWTPFFGESCFLGNTNIKKGITTSTFNSVPDAPISSFELTLPEGSHSALATDVPAKAKGNMCGQALKMPTTIVGQNGAQIRQTTKIAVTGCARHKRAKKPRHKTRRKRK
jgi:hypothetical protein